VDGLRTLMFVIIPAAIVYLYTVFMKYEILIFDLDDTLIDNKESVRAAFKKMLAAQNLAYSEDSFTNWYEIDKKFWIDWQDGLVEIPDELKHETGKKSDMFLDWVRSQRVLIYFNHSISKERAIELNNIYMASLHEVVIAIEGAPETLKYLSKKYKIIVATNGPQIATKQKLDKIRCLQYVTEDLVYQVKPTHDFFAILMPSSLAVHLFLGWHNPCRSAIPNE
jgi:FMN phosphatase YigB (HAD superfamily)